jgi:hypothetical protein
VLCIGAVATVQSSRHNKSQNVNDNTSQISSAAFRDGLFLGRLAAEHGEAPHIATGRWKTQDDQALFVTGYQRGYSESLATRSAPTR